MRQLFIILIFSVLCNTLIFAADSLTVVMKSNDVHTFNIGEIQKLTFPAGSLKVYTKSSGEYTYQNTDIRYFSFKSNQNGTGIMVPASEKNLSLMLFPNPSSDRLNIEFADYEGVGEIAVYNGVGKIMIFKKLTDKKSCLDIKHLTKGFYVCKVISGQKSGVSAFVKN